MTTPIHATFVGKVSDAGTWPVEYQVRSLNEKKVSTQRANCQPNGFNAIHIL